MERDSLSVSFSIESSPNDGQPGADNPLPVSPCIAVCALDEDDVCVGCRRPLKEIVEWPRMSATEQQALLDALAVRP